MNFDIPHMLASGLIIFAIIAIIDHASAFENVSKGRKTVFKFAGIFVAIIILNLIWPYGTGT
ncbi:hypothetical protein R5H30_21390 [Sulfitobacter sp. D35]|uniref:hypothetical protein n=1 Tax=Sulfitobacter sp. D35 TaxID=3083252 RepID=UPI00296E472C|nr:hypothetical protein [Sulfitobacter sp. D35]MDW4500556.1 hypothetical protein [Sulfitobacter sp. D35]